MLLYFDTSVFLRWFTERDEKKYKDCIEGINAIINSFESDKSDKVEIITSAITVVEILPKKTKEPAYGKISSMLDDIDIYPLEIPIAKLAALLRDAFQYDNHGKLEAPDAVHIATAIYLQADYLCTTDNQLIDIDEKFIKKFADKKIEIVSPPVPGIGKMLIP